MIRTIYELAKRTMSYGEICNFLSENLKSLDSDYTNEGYYIAGYDEYALTNYLTISASSSFDIFGNSKTGGHTITVKHIPKSIEHVIFSHNISTSNGKYIENESIICDETIIDLLEEIEKEENTVTEDLFLDIPRENLAQKKMTWTNLPDDIRLKNENVKEIFETFYLAAIEKVDETRDYNNISPYGGLDISYFPCSYGECFYDKVQTLFYFMNMEKSDFTKLVLEFISNKDENDDFLPIYEKRKTISNIINELDAPIDEMKNWEEKRNTNLALERRLLEEEESFDVAMENVFALRSEEKNVRMMLEKKTWFEKIMHSIKFINYFSKREKELMVRLNEIRNKKRDLAVNVKNSKTALAIIRRKIAKLENEMNNTSLNILEKAFVDFLDECDYEDYREGKEISIVTYRKFVEQYQKYA